MLPNEMVCGGESLYRWGICLRDTTQQFHLVRNPCHTLTSALLREFYISIVLKNNSQEGS